MSRRATSPAVHAGEDVKGEAQILCSLSRRWTDSLILAAAVIALSWLVFVFLPFPADDFLRHVRYVDYRELGGYGYMFPFSSFEKYQFSFYYGFDLITAAVRTLGSPLHVVVFYEIIFSSLFFIAVIFNMKACIRTSSPVSLLPYFIICAFLLMNPLLSARLYLIRPCILMAILFLFALRGRGLIVGVLSAFAMAFLYYLYFFYTVPLILAHRFGGDRRFAQGLFIGSLLSLAAWLLLTDLTYLLLIQETALSIFQRHGITIRENTFSVGQLFNPFIFIVLIIFTTAAYRGFRDDVFYAFVFTLPLAIQNRYFADLTLPLMTIYAVRHSHWLTSFYIQNKKLVDVFALLSVVLLVPPLSERTIAGSNSINLDNLSLERGARVFADSIPLNMAVVFWNKEPVRVIPSPEPAWSDQESRSLLTQIGKSLEVDASFCNFARSHQIDYLVSQYPVSADCVSYVSSYQNTKRRITVWRYVPDAAQGGQ